MWPCGPIAEQSGCLARRSQDFQLISLKLLAEHLLLGCLTYSNKRALQLYVPGEATRARLVFPHTPVKIYASKNNPGAEAIAAQLKVSMVGPEVTSTLPEWKVEENHPNVLHLFDDRTLHATRFLLYLNRETFCGAESEALAAELRHARAAGAQIVMLHENAPDAGGCKVGHTALPQGPLQFF